MSSVHFGCSVDSLHLDPEPCWEDPAGQVVYELRRRRKAEAHRRGARRGDGTRCQAHQLCRVPELQDCLPEVCRAVLLHLRGRER